MFNPYKSAIESCAQSAQICERYASEFAGTMGNTVRFCMDAAVICHAAATLMSRGSRMTPEVCRLCAHTCEICATECDKSSDEQLETCAEACRACAEECLKTAENGVFDMEVQGSSVQGYTAAAI
jgi:hypothetical protein